MWKNKEIPHRKWVEHKKLAKKLAVKGRTLIRWEGN